MVRLLILLVAAAGAFAGPPQLLLRDTQGHDHSTQEWRGAKGVVVFFVMTDCPLSTGYVP